jgi:hypothetical protein
LIRGAVETAVSLCVPRIVAGGAVVLVTVEVDP